MSGAGREVTSAGRASCSPSLGSGRNAVQEPTNQPGSGRGAKGWCRRDWWGRGAEKGCRSPTRPHLVPGLWGGRQASWSQEVGEPGFGNVKPIRVPEGSAWRLMPEWGEWGGKGGAGPRPVFTPGVKAGAEAEQPELGKRGRPPGHRGAGGHPLPGAQPRRPRSPDLTSAAWVPPHDPGSRTVRGSGPAAALGPARLSAPGPALRTP